MSTLQREKWLTGVPLSDRATGLDLNHLTLISVRKGYPSRWPGAISWKSLSEPLSLPLGDRQLLTGEVVGKPKPGPKAALEKYLTDDCAQNGWGKTFTMFWKQMLPTKRTGSWCLPCLPFSRAECILSNLPTNFVNSPASSDENYRVAPRHFSG